MKVITVDQDQLGQFTELAWQIYRDASDPDQRWGALWIPPPRAAVQDALAGRDQFASYGQMKLFALVDDSAANVGQSAGQSPMVARLAAIFNPRLIDDEGRPLGLIGYFESRDIGAACTPLFDAACAWLAERGAYAVMGPMNGGAHTPHRLQISGFDTEPFFGEPRNPPYYPSLFELAGFASMARWDTYVCDPEALSRIESHIDAFLQSQERQYDIESPALGDLDAILARIHRLLDVVWQGHPGYATFDFAEMLERYRGLFVLMTQGDVMFMKNQRDEDVGFFVGYPDYAQEVRELDGDIERWGHWLGGPLPRRWVSHTVGILPEARGRVGSYSLTRHRIRYAIERGYRETVSALVNERWNLFRKLGLKVDRSYQLYRKLVR